MTLSIVLALFFALVLLAVIPGPGIMIVVARTLSHGFKGGTVTTAGIVMGDFIFICLAIFGLTALSELMGSVFLIVKYAGAAYLIWLGIKIFRAKKPYDNSTSPSNRKHSANFIAGLLTTLGNPKAILFYASFFPAFLDLSSVTLSEVGIIMLVTAFAVGGVMLAYSYVATKSRSLFKSSSVATYLRYATGSILIGGGAYIAVRS